MKQKLMLVPAIGLLASVTATAQDSAADASEAAAVTVEVAAEDYPRPPDPVVVEPAPPAPPAPRYPREPRVKNWRESRPAPADYPIASWQAGQEGLVEYDVSVDAEGKPTKCMVSVSSGHAALDAKTCEVAMERAEFNPALDGEGMPVAGTYYGSHNWRKREPDLPTMSITFRYLHGAEGNSSECEFLKVEGELPEEMRRDIEKAMAEDADACRLFANRRGIPYRDANGVPVTKRVTVSFDVVVEEVSE